MLERRPHLAWILVLASVAGCYPDPGARDEVAAREIVYDPSGVPAYAGQAIVIESCGNGGYCHSERVDTLADRHGAPAGLTFDLRLASLTIESEEAETQRLLRDHRNIADSAGLVWYQVGGGHMPPGGRAWEDYQRAITPPGMTQPVRFQRVDDDGVTFHDLPRLRGTEAEPLGPTEAEEAREIVRNWLASGAPVVERTQCRRGCGQVGDMVPVCERTCVDPTWESIYLQIIRPSCALSPCHDDSEPAAAMDLSVAHADVPFRDEADALERITPVLGELRGREARGSLCGPGGNVRVTPGDSASSLLYLKVSSTSTDPVCGDRMPLSGSPLTEQRLCALRTWIDCGACGPGDTSCDACVAEHRAECGVSAPFDFDRGGAECTTVPACPNHLAQDGDAGMAAP